MAATTFVLNGDEIHLSSDQVIRAVWGMFPDEIQTWGVVVNGRSYPVEQVFRQAIGRTDFAPLQATDVLERLGFTVPDGDSPMELAGDASAADDEPPARPIDEPTGHPVDETRLAALNAAVAYASTRQLDVPGVLAAADAFDAWLRNPRARG